MKLKLLFVSFIFAFFSTHYVSFAQDADLDTIFDNVDIDDDGILVIIPQYFDF